jgi:hypothetical protein
LIFGRNFTTFCRILKEQMFSRGGNKMDRISCLAYLLYQVNHEEVKKAALQLVSGEISIKELRSNSQFLPYIKEAEKTLKKNTLSKNDVCDFVEQYLYAY